jgi:hypothetical protein
MQYTVRVYNSVYSMGTWRQELESFPPPLSLLFHPVLAQTSDRGLFLCDEGDPWKNTVILWGASFIPLWIYCTVFLCDYIAGIPVVYTPRVTLQSWQCVHCTFADKLSIHYHSHIVRGSPLCYYFCTPFLKRAKISNKVQRVKYG